MTVSKWRQNFHFSGELFFFKNNVHLLLNGNIFRLFDIDI